MKLHNLLKFLSAIWITASIMLVISPAHAVNPDEMLEDPALEARAREISAELRCLVCQNQSIDDSDAPLARDLRILVRERISKGDSNEQAMEFLVSRYGEFVLLKPTFSVKNWILWLFGPIVLILGLVAVHRLYIKNRLVTQRAEKTGSSILTAEEEARLKKILSDESEA